MSLPANQCEDCRKSPGSQLSRTLVKFMKKHGVPQAQDQKNEIEKGSLKDFRCETRTSLIIDDVNTSKTKSIIEKLPEITFERSAAKPTTSKMNTSDQCFTSNKPSTSSNNPVIKIPIILLQKMGNTPRESNLNNQTNHPSPIIRSPIKDLNNTVKKKGHPHKFLNNTVKTRGRPRKKFSNLAASSKTRDGILPSTLPHSIDQQNQLTTKINKQNLKKKQKASKLLKKQRSKERAMRQKAKERVKERAKKLRQKLLSRKKTAKSKL